MDVVRRKASTGGCRKNHTHSTTMIHAQDRVVASGLRPGISPFSLRCRGVLFVPRRLVPWRHENVDCHRMFPGMSPAVRSYLPFPISKTHSRTFSSYSARDPRGLKLVCWDRILVVTCRSFAVLNLLRYGRTGPFRLPHQQGLDRSPTGYVNVSRVVSGSAPVFPVLYLVLFSSHITIQLILPEPL